MGKTAIASVGASKAHKKEQKNKASTQSSQPKAMATTEPDFMDNKDTVEDLNLAGSIWSNLIYNDSIWKSFRCLKKLELNGSDLSTLPSSLEAVSPTLEILFLSENKFNAIPEVVGKLHRLRMISFRGNCLTELSAANLPTSLIWLILTNNQISRIDQNVSKLQGLRKLMLSHNRLTEIPSELGECKNLELVRLASNCINTALPEKFLSLPKLAWISLGGNPISKINTQKMKVIDKSSVFFDEKNVLGKGASGTVYRGQYMGKDVAVKVFKHDSKGSDGRPEDEAMINSIIDHHFTVSSHGVFRKENMHDSEDADVIEGMVMELLENATAIGKPPSFATCTRDAGPEDDAKSLDTDRVLSIIWNIANALEYVHSTKVMNGDVYLHNTLQCGNAARLSDWGASFVYNDSMVADSSKSADIFEKIEVLAFGRLVQDMLLWYLKVACPDSTGSTFSSSWSQRSMSRGPFKDLMASILQPDQSKRPTFGEIKESLAKIPEFQSHI
jgi:hypothetical protein